MNSQVKEALEYFYRKEDPWGYKNNKDDKARKEKIIKACGKKKFKRALDIGAGEGWITGNLPAKKIYGYEISDNASSRFPDNVKKVKKIFGKYDLILASGVLYEECGCKELIEIINKHASGTVVTCNIKGREISEGLKKPKEESEFPYRGYTEVLRVYDYSSLNK